MVARSAGALFYRQIEGRPEVLLVHPGGPFWRKRDTGAWQIPKGMVMAGEDAETAARREVAEELGVAIREALVPLGSIRQAGGKIVEAFAVRQDLDADAITSNSFELEWPPKSGQIQSFPEVDAARWLTISAARGAILPSQEPLLDRLERLLAGSGDYCAG